jgi:aspartate aminotransferase, cytoplasmic
LTHHPDTVSSQAAPNTRLTQLKDHTMGSLSTDEPIHTLFDENVVPQAPEDPLFGLMAAYRKDDYEKKVDLGIGAYRDNNAKPWVLPVVKKVSHRWWRNAKID